MGAIFVLLSELVAIVVLLAVLYAFGRSVIVIGPAQVGLVVRRFSPRHNSTDSPIAFDGEAGYQSDLLMPGVRFKLWPRYTVSKYPWVQVPAGEIGVVISQIGDRLPTGAKSAVYRAEFGNFTDLHAFLSNGGQKGVQRPVLPPGTTAFRSTTSPSAGRSRPSPSAWSRSSCASRSSHQRANRTSWGS
jgi:uncharacterized membrane protein YqiK